MLLKGLIAVACLAVIAFVGTFFWERYQAAQSVEERRVFLSFCDLNYGAADVARREGRGPAPHVQEGMARCRAAGVEKGQ